MMKRFLFAALLAASTGITALGAGDSVLTANITDESIVFPESFETDTRKLLESWYMQNYTATDNRYKGPDVRTDDEEIKRRLASLPTVIEMPFNQIVRSYIDRYTQKGRAQVATALGLGLYYNPIFEQALEARKLPLELKYLPMIESGLDPNAVSRHGATGLWQFMIGPAKGMGMEVNSLVDMRRDPYVSSEKAAEFLANLYDSYGDWSLAIAAYNCGPGAVNKAINRAGGDPRKQDFWSIYKYLPAETRGYVPMFIAANYVMNYHQKHNISPVLPTKPLVTDTVAVAERIHFEQIAAVLNIDKDELRVLNPQFRADVIPGTPEKPYMLILPSQQVHAFIMSHDDILAYQADRYRRRLEAEPGVAADELIADNAAEAGTVANPADLAPAEEEAAIIQTETPGVPYQQPSDVNKRERHQVNHKVAQGETLAQIAAIYEVTPSEIRRWNSLRRNAVRPGQMLRIETSVAGMPQRTAAAAADKKEQPAAQASAKSTKNQTAQADTRQSKNKRNKQAKQNKPKKPAVTNHEVKSGENLSTIAKRYGVSVDELKKANSGTGDMIHPGDKIKIPSKAKSGKKGSKSKSKKKRRK